jgi:hypothetical protein
MGANHIGLIAEWAPAVEAYRAAGTHFYWVIEDGEELPFPAEEDYFGGYKRFRDLSNCYSRIRPQRSATRSPTSPACSMRSAP